MIFERILVLAGVLVIASVSGQTLAPVKNPMERPAAPKNTIAVLDLQGKAVAQDEASILTDKLRGELLKTGRYQMIERAQMEAILKEQGFQQSGCTDQSCAVEVGQLVGVEKIVTGSVGKIGRMFLLSVRMIDVAKGKILANVDKEITGTIEEVLISGIPFVAQSLIYQMDQATPAAVPAGGVQRAPVAPAPRPQAAAPAPVQAAPVAQSTVVAAPTVFAYKSTFYAGLAIPMGDFKLSELGEDNAMYGANGFGAGLRLTKPFSNTPLAFALDFAFMMNPYNVETLENLKTDDLESFFLSLGYDYNVEVRVEEAKYKTIQVMPGLKFSMPISTNSEFYGIGQAAFNYFIPADVKMVIVLDGDETEITNTRESAFSFGFSFGAGLSLDRLNVGLRYSLMGSPKIKGTYKTEFWDGTSTSGDLDDRKPSLRCLLITAGLNF